MGVNSLPKTVNRQRRGCNLYPGRTAPESSTLTARLPGHLTYLNKRQMCANMRIFQHNPHLSLCKKNCMTTSESKRRFFTKRIDSNRFA